MPYRLKAAEVLERWREVERQLSTVVDGSLEAEALLAEAITLRDEYQALVRAARAERRPEPPPFPEIGAA
jgi:hypothetical protein